MTKRRALNALCGPRGLLMDARPMGDLRAYLDRRGVCAGAIEFQPVKGCAPLNELMRLARAGLLAKTSSYWAWGRQWDDCHEIALRVFIDLRYARAAGRVNTERFWRWRMADCYAGELGDHSWIECDGRAFDFSHGLLHPPGPVLTMRADAFRAMRMANDIRQAEITSRRSPDETKARHPLLGVPSLSLCETATAISPDRPAGKVPDR